MAEIWTCSSPARRRRNKWRAMKFGLIRRIAALPCVTSHPAVLETTVTKTAETASASGHLRDARLFLVQSNAHKVGRYYSDWIRGMLCETLQRSRDLLPLPSVTFWPSEVDAGQIDVATGLDICNMCIAGLNFLSQGMKDVCPKGRRQSFYYCASRNSKAHLFQSGAISPATGRALWDGSPLAGCLYTC